MKRSGMQVGLILGLAMIVPITLITPPQMTLGVKLLLAGLIPTLTFFGGMLIGIVSDQREKIRIIQEFRKEFLSYKILLEVTESDLTEIAISLDQITSTLRLFQTGGLQGIGKLTDEEQVDSTFQTHRRLLEEEVKNRQKTFNEMYDLVKEYSRVALPDRTLIRYKRDYRNYLPGATREKTG